MAVEWQDGAAVDGVAGLAFAGELDAAPVGPLQGDAREFGSGSPGVGAAGDFLGGEGGLLMDDELARGGSGVPVLVQGQAAGHDQARLLAAEVGVVQVVSLADVVGDEVHAAAVGVEYLAAAGDEARGSVCPRAQRVGQPDVGSLRVNCPGVCGVSTARGRFWRKGRWRAARPRWPGTGSAVLHR